MSHRPARPLMPGSEPRRRASKRTPMTTASGSGAPRQPVIREDGLAGVESDQRPTPLWPDGRTEAASLTGFRPVITPYLVDARTPSAAIVVCPGGGYQIRA